MIPAHQVVPGRVSWVLVFDVVAHVGWTRGVRMVGVVGLRGVRMVVRVNRWVLHRCLAGRGLRLGTGITASRRQLDSTKASQLVLMGLHAIEKGVHHRLHGNFSEDVVFMRYPNAVGRITRNSSALIVEFSRKKSLTRVNIVTLLII